MKTHTIELLIQMMFIQKEHLSLDVIAGLLNNLHNNFYSVKEQINSLYKREKGIGEFNIKKADQSHDFYGYNMQFVFKEYKLEIGFTCFKKQKLTTEFYVKFNKIKSKHKPTLLSARSWNDMEVKLKELLNRLYVETLPKRRPTMPIYLTDLNIDFAKKLIHYLGGDISKITDRDCWVSLENKFPNMRKGVEKYIETSRSDNKKLIKVFIENMVDRCGSSEEWAKKVAAKKNISLKNFSEPEEVDCEEDEEDLGFSPRLDDDWEETWEEDLNED